MWRGPCHVCQDRPLGAEGCDDCRIGCFKPARFRNPNFGRKGAEDTFGKWWLFQYSYAEWLCAQHYDEVVADKSDYEEWYGEEADDGSSQEP
jgi:hypothetical protein